MDSYKINCNIDLFAKWNIIVLYIKKNKKRGKVMSLISSQQIGEKWHISRRRVQVLCEEGRIPGAFKVGNTWAIPDDAEKPQDRRQFNKFNKKHHTLGKRR